MSTSKRLSWVLEYMNIFLLWFCFPESMLNILQIKLDYHNKYYLIKSIHIFLFQIPLNVEIPGHATVLFSLSRKRRYKRDEEKIKIFLVSFISSKWDFPFLFEDMERNSKYAIVLYCRVYVFIKVGCCLMQMKRLF